MEAAAAPTAPAPRPQRARGLGMAAKQGGTTIMHIMLCMRAPRQRGVGYAVIPSFGAPALPRSAPRLPNRRARARRLAEHAGRAGDSAAAAAAARARPPRAVASSARRSVHFSAIRGCVAGRLCCAASQPREVASGASAASAASGKRRSICNHSQLPRTRSWSLSPYSLLVGLYHYITIILPSYYHPIATQSAAIPLQSPCNPSAISLPKQFQIISQPFYNVGWMVL